MDNFLHQILICLVRGICGVHLQCLFKRQFSFLNLTKAQISPEQTFIDFSEFGVQSYGRLAVIKSSFKIFQGDEARRSVAVNSLVRLNLYSVGVVVDGSGVVLFFKFCVSKLLLFLSFFVD